MDRRVTGWLAEALRFASVVAVYWILQAIPFKFGFAGGKIVESLLEALIAGMVVAVALDLVFGTPVVSVVWSIDTDPPMSGRPVIDAEKRLYNVQVHTTGSSFKHRITMCRARKQECHIHVDLFPDSSVTVQVQSVGANTHARNAPNGAGLIIEQVSLKNGINSVVDVSMKRRNKSRTPNDLQVATRVCWGSCTHNWPKLMRIEVAVDGFHLRGKA